MTCAISSKEKAAATVQRAMFADGTLRQPIETCASKFEEAHECCSWLYRGLSVGQSLCDLNRRVDVEIDSIHIDSFK